MELPGGVQMHVQVTAEQTGGAFSLLTDVAPPGWHLPPHRHLGESETMHVTSGALWLEMGGERHELHAGDTVHVPAGTLHASGTLGAQPLHRVLVFSPGGMERFFEELAATTDSTAMLDLATRHGWRFR